MTDEVVFAGLMATVFFGFVALVSCGKPAQNAPPSVERGRLIFTNNCSVCHTSGPGPNIRGAKEEVIINQLSGKTNRLMPAFPALLPEAKSLELYLAE